MNGVNGFGGGFQQLLYALGDRFGLFETHPQQIVDEFWDDAPLSPVDEREIGEAGA